MEIDSFSIYQGDCLSLLRDIPGSFVDAVVADSPYCSGGISPASRRADPADKYQATGTVRKYPPMLGDNRDQRGFLAWATLWLTESLRVAKDGAPLLLFSDWRQLPVMSDALQASGWLWSGLAVWNKRSSRPRMGFFRPQCEYILTASKGPFIPAHNICFPGVFDIPVNTHEKVHITSKPVALLRELLAVTPDNALILDPFLGGGTTAVAAIQTGRRCLGLELSAEYAAIAKERCLEACREAGKKEL